MPVLVTYATNTGTTRSIAESIASRLHAAGFAVTLLPVTSVFSCETYSAIIIGSALQHSQWLADAMKFIAVESMILQNKPVWTFSVGMGPASQGIVGKKAMRRESMGVEMEIRRRVLRVREHRYFAGKDDGKEMNVAKKLVWGCMGGRFGDFRDWEGIERWADGIAKELRMELGS
jgi:menaquinone-dependent protoporphyrinogen oxidase